MIEYFKKQILLNKKNLNLSTISNNEKSRILKRANELMNNIFVFDKNLDMEKCLSPYTAYNWYTKNNDDEEWTFMLHRFEYINYLIGAAYLLDDSSYLFKTKEMIFSWISNYYPNSTRTLDLAINIDSQMQAIMYISSILTDDEINIFVNYCSDCIKYLYDNYQSKYTLSNWGSIQTCIILRILKLIDINYANNKIYIWAKKELITQVDLQIYDDGVFWEHSTLYHLELLNNLLKLICSDKRINKKIYSKTYLLAKAIYLQVNNKNEIEALGDSDRINVSDVLSRAAYIFNDQYFKAKAFSSLDFESIYILGSDVIKDYENILPKYMKEYIFNGKYSGVYVITANNNYTLFSNTSMGSGHGHCDNLHISIDYNNTAYLVDCGRYTYLDNDQRIYLKSMYAHNSVILDDKPASNPKSSWDMQNFVNVGQNYFNRVKNISLLSGYIYDQNYFHNRKVIVIDIGVWLIIDTIYSKGSHIANNYFNLHPDTKFEDNLLKYYTNCDYEIKTGYYSRQYNQIEKNQQIVTKKSFTDNTTLINCFFDNKYNITVEPLYQDQNLIDDINFGFAKTINISDNESYTIIVMNKEIYTGRKILYCKNTPIHSKVCVIHIKNGKKKVYRLLN